MMIEDTIAAISTPVGAAGIGIIRISGLNSVSMVEKIFKSPRGKKLAGTKNHSMLYGHIVESGKVLDEVLVSVMRGPHSFTAEDVVEINCHGGVVAVRKVLEAVLKAGARPAEPGEFSKRAFLNGRIDLAQAESVIDLINAKTEKSLRAAVDQLEGILSREVEKLSGELLRLIAHIEAGIDFPEHDIEEMSRSQIKHEAQQLGQKLQKLIDSAETGRVLREGLRTVIIGKPNVGKSSLLNALVREKRAIVTDIPGTTRDVIEEVVNIRGIPLVLIDTAGIRETQDVVEKIGVEKSREMLARADLILFMIDASTGLTVEDLEILPYTAEKNSIIIINKTDLSNDLNTSVIEKHVSKNSILEMSLLHGQGLAELEQRIEDMVYAGIALGGEDTMVTNVRHKNALERAACSLEEVLGALEAHLPTDCMAIDLRAAWESLGEITGETVSEDLVDQIFSQFCIGK